MRLSVALLAVFFIFAHFDIACAQDDETESLRRKLEELEKQVNELTQEARARKTLEATEKEKTEKEKEVLETVDRDYTLMSSGSLALDYSLGYSYSSNEVITSLDEALTIRQYNHSVTHNLATSYGVLDNLTARADVPFVYKYNKIGTDQELDETDIGDISLGLSYQPFKAEQGKVSTVVGLTAVLPTGRSPFKIDINRELSTGNGYYAVAAGVNFSQASDPVVFFWSLNYTHNFPVDGLRQNNLEYLLEEVEPGDSIGFGAGLGFAISYQVYMNFQFSYSYQYSSTYKFDVREVDTGSSAAGNLGFGVGYKISPKTTLVYSVSYSLTEPTFSMTLRLPFNFAL